VSQFTFAKWVIVPVIRPQLNGQGVARLSPLGGLFGGNADLRRVRVNLRANHSPALMVLPLQGKSA